jgi:NADH pyrophosphatase NudC (nudix superfamily)
MEHCTKLYQSHQKARYAGHCGAAAFVRSAECAMIAAAT